VRASCRACCSAPWLPRYAVPLWRCCASLPSLLPPRVRTADSAAAVAPRRVDSAIRLDPPPLSPLYLPSALPSAGAYSSTYHPDWSILAARIAVSDLHKMTDPCFSKNSQRLRDHIHPTVRAAYTCTCAAEGQAGGQQRGSRPTAG